MPASTNDLHKSIANSDLRGELLRGRELFQKEQSHNLYKCITIRRMTNNHFQTSRFLHFAFMLGQKHEKLRRKILNYTEIGIYEQKERKRHFQKKTFKKGRKGHLWHFA